MTALTITSLVTSALWNKDAISIEGLNLSIASKQLLNDACFSIPRSPACRITILGRNGCGKSTLMRWICSSKPHCAMWSIFQVEQEIAPTNNTVISVVLGAHIERGRLWSRQAELETKEELTDEEIAEYETIGETLESMKADSDEPRARRILYGLGFSESQVNNSLTHLSGGWRARVSLAQGLFMEPDLLLLDEPTNHLDLNGVIWLQEYLLQFKKSVIIISHNIGFIKTISNIIWYYNNNNLSVFKCSYDRFIKSKIEEETKTHKEWTQIEKQIVAFKKKHNTSEAARLSKLAIGRRPPKPYKPKFFFLEDTYETSRFKHGGALYACDSIILGYNATAPPVLSNVMFALHPGCHIALVGENGSGKSTLIKFIQGALEPLAGNIARKKGLTVCSFDQHFFHSMPEEKTPVEYIKSVAPDCSEELIRRILGASGLDGITQTQRIGTLSGGQKSRVYFGSISAQSPDILLLDEPTNHLDIETIEGLRDGLKEFDGASIIVSHDIDFLEEIATEVWTTANGQLVRIGEGIDGLETYISSVVAKTAY